MFTLHSPFFITGVGIPDRSLRTEFTVIVQHSGVKGIFVAIDEKDLYIHVYVCEIEGPESALGIT